MLKVVFRHTCTNMSISFMTKQPGQKTKNDKCTHRDLIAAGLLVPSAVRASSCGATSRVGGGKGRLVPFL